MSKPIKVLFICLGNICRSPTAHGVFAQRLAESDLAGKVDVDSAGTHAFHVGNPPDQRSQAAARKRGFDLSQLRARRVEAEDGDEFDYLLVMDNENLANTKARVDPSQHDKIRLFLEFASDYAETEVPDPYYGGATGFEHVLDLVEAASDGLLAHIRSNHF